MQLTGTKSAYAGRLSERTLVLLTDLHQELICQRIREARIRSGLTQVQVAEKLHMTERNYRYYEATRVPWSRLTELAEILNVDREWLINGDEDSRPEVVDARAVMAEIRDLRALVERLLGTDKK